MRTFSGLITELEPNQIFVFGSNPEGRHGKGAAETARRLFGAKYGQGYGRQGRSYAIVTKDLRVNKNGGMRSVPLHKIKRQIRYFIQYATEHPELEFFVTMIGSKLAGYSCEEIASLFIDYNIPNNVIMNEQYARIINEKRQRLSIEES